MTKLILASASETRAHLLRAAGVAFDVVSAAVDEAAVKASMPGADSRIVADALAELKAVRASSANPGRLVLGADQVLAYGSEIVSKSQDLAAADALLRRLRGKRHTLVTAAVLAKDGQPIWRHVDTTALWMRDFSDVFLKDYLQTEGERILGAVGCYHFEGRGAQLFEKVEGDYFSVLGIPLLPLLAALREQGVIER